MSRPNPRSRPGPLRVWLNQAMHSGALERIAARCPFGAGGSQGTIDYALALMEALRDPHGDARSLDEIAAEAARFREWVESRQQVSRKIILSESRQAETYDPTPEAPARRTPPRRAERPSSEGRSAWPRSDPMWDDLLDGLGS